MENLVLLKYCSVCYLFEFLNKNGTQSIIKKVDVTICTVVLGLLPLISSRPILTQIQGEFSENNSDTSSFCLPCQTRHLPGFRSLDIYR